MTTRTRKGTHSLIRALACALLTIAQGNTAETRIWDGNPGDRWSSPGNWVGNVAPSPGDHLVFPASGVLNKSMLNDLPADTHIASIEFQQGGYVVSGARFVLDGDVRSTTLSGATGALAINTFQTDIALSGTRTVTVNAGRLVVSGSVIDHTGATGGLTKTGTGALQLAGSTANTFTGETWVRLGTLELNKTVVGGALSPTGKLTISGGGTAFGLGSGRVQYLRSDQILVGVLIQIGSKGSLDLNGFNDDLGSIQMIGGDGGLDPGAEIQTGSGTLTLRRNMVVTGGQAGCRILGALDLGSSTKTIQVNAAPTPGTAPELTIDARIGSAAAEIGLAKTGVGRLRLGGANTFLGPVTVGAGVLIVGHAQALGDSLGSTAVNLHASLEIDSGVHVAGEPLTLNTDARSPGALVVRSGSSSFAGSIALTSPSTIEVAPNAELALTGPMTGAGGITKTGAGRLIISGALPNTYLGRTEVQAGLMTLLKSAADGAIPTDLLIGEPSGAAGSAIVEVPAAMQTQQISDTTRVTIMATGNLRVNGALEHLGTITGSGMVELQNGATLQLTGPDSSLFSGRVTGLNGAGTLNRLRKSGAGTLTLTGPNDFEGESVVMQGTLVADGIQRRSDIRVLGGATLRGIGQTGPLSTFPGGHVAPGSETSPGTLTATRLLLQEDSVFHVRINGSSPGIDHDQLRIEDYAELKNGLPNLDAKLNYVPEHGTSFTIIERVAGSPVFGTFRGLAEGAVITFPNHVPLTVRYSRGSGNDVVLAYETLPLALSRVVVRAGNGNGRIQPDECNDILVTLTNQFSTTLRGLRATLVSDTPGAIVSQPHSAYPDIPISGRADNTTSFQLSTMPSVACGTLLHLRLKVESDGFGTFTVPITLPVGGYGNPLAYNSTAGTTGIGRLSSTVQVTGFAEPLGKVAVSVHLPASAGGLSLYLVAPDGLTRVPLIQTSGPTPALGNSCAATSRLTFDDDALNGPGPSASPLVGTFRPAGQLLNLFGRRGSQVNGAWRLELEANSSSTPVQLNCWSILLHPLDCSPGSGVCSLCPEELEIRGNLLTTLLRNPSPGPLYRAALGSRSSCDGGLFAFQCEEPIGMGLAHDVYLFENSGPERCITLRLEGPCGFFSGLVLNPTSTSLRSCPPLAGGTQDAITGSYSVTVPANTPFLVFVQNVRPSNDVCGDYNGTYKLTVSGGSCDIRIGAINRSNGQATISYSTLAGGYFVERSPSASGGPWQRVQQTPTVVDHDYQVITPASPTREFFRLKKP